MSKEKLNKTEKSILTGMEEAILHAKGVLKAKTHSILLPIVDVHQARNNLNLTQKQFAATFGVSIATLRNWEQKRRLPTGAAKVLLRIIQKEPEIVKQVLRG